MNAVRALLFDVGNTRVKWGLLDKGRIARSGSVAHEKLRHDGFGALTARLPRDVDRVLACNVAGQTFATRLSGVIGIHCGCEVQFAHAEREAHGLVNAYRTPRHIGVDRWVAMIGARAEFRGALCVVDAGTAVTIDAVDRDGRHLGGLIVPGLRLMAAALFDNTSDIPRVEHRGPRDAEGIELFANTTERGVKNGALAAVCGAIDRSVRALRSGGHRPKVVLTGGDASRILERIDAETLHRPNLVLQGLACMVQNDK